MTDSSSSKVEAAKDQAAGLKDEAVASGQHVAETAADQAGSVVGEAKVQAKDLIGQAQSELRDQAGAQQKRVASGIRSLSDELGSMAEGSTSSGVASDLVQQAASRAGSIASWLDDRDPGTLLSDVRAYAARKPGTFIAVAAVAGIVAGRLTRSLAGNAKDAKEAAAAPTTDTPAPAAPVVSTPVTPVVPVAPATYEPTLVESTYVTPAYVEPTFADAAPIDDVTLRSHSVDDEYGDSDTVESLFDEPARPSFDETVQGDDYRGERS